MTLRSCRYICSGLVRPKYSPDRATNVQTRMNCKGTSYGFARALGVSVQHISSSISILLLAAMQSYKLAQFPQPYSTIHLALFKKVTNATEIRKRLVEAATTSGVEGDELRRQVDFGFIEANLVSLFSRYTEGFHAHEMPRNPYITHGGAELIPDRLYPTYPHSRTHHPLARLPFYTDRSSICNTNNVSSSTTEDEITQPPLGDPSDAITEQQHLRLDSPTWHIRYNDPSPRDPLWRWRASRDLQGYRGCREG